MIKSFKLFTTPSCPNCPIVKQKMQEVKLEGDLIDASQPAGLDAARKYDIARVPTVVFLDEQGNVVKKCNTVDEIEETLK